jgi:hypothetical protein
MAAPREPLATDSPADSPLVLERLGAILAQKLGGDGHPEPMAMFSGNINGILKLRYGGRPLGVRLALNTYRFRYEKDIIKEIFALFLIYFARDAENDDVARDIVDGILASPVGSHVGHALVHRVIHYDWSMTTLPWPFFIYEWVDGEILWAGRESGSYFTAGQNLARLHRITFQSCYQDIFRIGREPLSWHQRFAAALAHERLQALPRLPAAAARRLEAIDPATVTPARPCLVHNDYSGGNIIVEAGGGQKIIDWDNWLVDAPELDLLKMKYWTAIGADGLLAPDPVLYSAFLQGYNSASGTVPDRQRFHACELLWLTRAYNFESTRHNDREQTGNEGGALARHYPPAAVYETYLSDL